MLIKLDNDICLLGPKWIGFQYLYNIGKFPFKQDIITVRRLSVHRGGGSHVTITDNALDLAVQGPTPSLSPQKWDIPPTADIGPTPLYWHQVVITGDLFKLVYLRTSTHQYWHLAVASETRTVGKRAVWILLECILVLIYDNFVKSVLQDGETKIEYRAWNPFRSKLAAAILGGIDNIHIKPGSKILYLGAASGTTVSHVSDLVGPVRFFLV